MKLPHTGKGGIWSEKERGSTLWPHESEQIIQADGLEDDVAKECVQQSVSQEPRGDCHPRSARQLVCCQPAARVAEIKESVHCHIEHLVHQHRPHNDEGKLCVQRYWGHS